MRPFRLINDPKSIDQEFIESELKAGKEVHIQFSKKIYTDKILSDIDHLCKTNDEHLGIRFYGHHFEHFDCKTVLKIPNVKCLYVDCLTEAGNINALKQLLFLKGLTIGIYELKDTEFLSSDNFKRLTKLTISETQTKAFNLGYLREFQNLKSLTISGHTKHIDAVGEIKELESLSLHAIKKTAVPFINNLKKLKSLRFLLGSRDNILELGENAIENLEIIWVRGFNDISNISNFKKLKVLQIEDQIQLPKINFDKVIPDLSDIKILNCKKLEALTGLKNLPQLNSLVVWKTNVDFAEFMKQELPGQLKTLGFYTKKSKTDKEIKAALESRGYICR
jgi:protein phosphatase 1 regulatory subunit 7